LIVTVLCSCIQLLLGVSLKLSCTTSTQQALEGANQIQGWNNLPGSPEEPLEEDNDPNYFIQAQSQSIYQRYRSNLSTSLGHVLPYTIDC